MLCPMCKEAGGRPSRETKNAVSCDTKLEVTCENTGRDFSFGDGGERSKQSTPRDWHYCGPPDVVDSGNWQHDLACGFV